MHVFELVVFCWAGNPSARDTHVSYLLLWPEVSWIEVVCQSSFTSAADYENSLPNDVAFHGKMWTLVAALFSLSVSLSLSLSLHVRLDWVGHLNGEAVCLVRSTHCVMYVGGGGHSTTDIICALSLLMYLDRGGGRGEHYSEYGLILHRWNSKRRSRRSIAV